MEAKAISFYFSSSLFGFSAIGSGVIGTNRITTPPHQVHYNLPQLGKRCTFRSPIPAMSSSFLFFICGHFNLPPKRPNRLQLFLCVCVGVCVSFCVWYTFDSVLYPCVSPCVSVPVARHFFSKPWRHRLRLIQTPFQYRHCWNPVPSRSLESTCPPLTRPQTRKCWTSVPNRRVLPQMYHQVPKQRLCSKMKPFSPILIGLR